MTSPLIQQIQILMHAQQIKCAESVFGKSNYMWLCSKKSPMIWMSSRDEFLIRQALTKVLPDQEVKVMKQLLAWLDEHPGIDCLKIPEMCLKLLNGTANANLMQEMNFSRKTSFRNSLRRFSFASRNTISPSLVVPPTLTPRRSVTFDEVATVYCIKN